MIIGVRASGDRKSAERCRSPCPAAEGVVGAPGLDTTALAGPPNSALERTAHSVGVGPIPGSVACGPPLSLGVQQRIRMSMFEQPGEPKIPGDAKANPIFLAF
jgi:hypothetical protein